MLICDCPVNVFLSPVIRTFEYFMNKPTGNFPKYYIFNNIIIYHFEDRILYS